MADTVHWSASSELNLGEMKQQQRQQQPVNPKNRLIRKKVSTKFGKQLIDDST